MPVGEECVYSAVRDCMVSLSVTPVSFEDELRIVRSELMRIRPQVYVPELYLGLTVDIVRAFRSDERLVLGPQASIDAALIGRSAALSAGRSIVSFRNLKEGMYAAILGAVPDEDRQGVARALQQALPDIARYLQKHIGGISLERIRARYRACWHDDFAPQHLQQQAAEPESAALAQLAGWAYRTEAIHKYRIFEVISEYLSAYDRGEDC